MKPLSLALAIVFAIALSACGGSDGPDDSTVTATSSDAEVDGAADDGPQDLADTVDDSAEEMAEDMVDTLEQVQAQAGGGSMTLTVGDQSWTFAPVLCAVGEDQIGQEGAEFVLSSIQDGKQMYVSIDSFGHSVTLDDVEDFENPSVSLSSAGGSDFIVLDGKSFSGEADFFDGTSDNLDTVSGTFSGTCP